MDYSSLVKKCNKLSEFSEPILTDIMYYAAKRDRLSERFDLLAKKYKQVFGKLDPAKQRLFKTQYIIHEVLKNKGLIHKYLNHSRIKALPREEYAYLQTQAENPWRFTFWFVMNSPSADFFEAVDIFTGDEFLLYSPGVSRTLQEMSVVTFGGLISSNGDCYQTFGPLIGFRSFQADDIFFYAGELDPAIETTDDLTDLIAKDLFSFLLLSVYSNFPKVQHQDQEILYVLSFLDIENFEMGAWENDFRVEYSREVFKMSLKKLEEFPHYACVYYHEQTKEMTISAMTDFGYNSLVSQLNNMGIQVPEEPDIRLHTSMKSAIREITGRDPELIPFESYFSQEFDTKVNSPELDALNDFLAELVPAINSRARFDLEDLIQKSGADPEAAKAIYEDLMRKLNR